MANKKKFIFIIISAIVVLLAGTLIFLYNYERSSSDSYYRDGYLPATVMSKHNKWGTERMEAYHISFFGSVENEGKYPTKDDEAINLTEEQIAAIREVLEDRHFEPYRKLWYRYDVMLGDGKKVTYKLDFKNQLVFVDEIRMAAQKTQKIVRGCIRLTDRETQVLKDVIQGSSK